MAGAPQRFTFSDLGIGIGAPRMKYRRRKDEEKTAIHWGQRKLHLSEVEFLSIFWDKNKIPNPTLVYAGAAGGTHIEMLSKMFPAIMFELYDPSKFDVKETDRIKIFNTYFTDEVAASYAGRDDIIFVSDIRTVDYKRIGYDELAARGITTYDAKEEPVGDYKVIKAARAAADAKVEEGIAGDMAMQQRWVEIINPMESLLKWRLEYPLNGQPKMYQGLKGNLFWQVFPGASSTEMRLRIPHGPAGVIEKGEWEIMEYEEWCFYHNAVVREEVQYLNIFTGTAEAIDYPELLNDYDSTAEAFIWKLYLEKFGITDVARQYEMTKKLSRELTELLNRHAAEGKKLTLADRRANVNRFMTRLPGDVFAKKNKPGPRTKPISPRAAPTVNPKAPVVIAPLTVTAKSPGIITPVKMVAPIVVAPPTVAAKSPGIITPVKMVAPVVVAPPTVAVKSPGTIVPVKMVAPVVVAPPNVAAKSPGTIVPVKMVAPVVVAPPTVAAKSPGTIVPVKMVAPVVVAPVVVAPKSPGTIVPVKMVTTVVVAPPTVTAKSPVVVAPVKIVAPVVAPVVVTPKSPGTIVPVVAKSPVTVVPVKAVAPAIVVTQPKTAVVVTAPKVAVVVPTAATPKTVVVTPKAAVVVNIPKATVPKAILPINK